MEVSKGAVSARSAGTGADAGVGAGVGAWAEVEASEGPRAMALQDPRNVMVDSFGFQQFFLI